MKRKRCAFDISMGKKHGNKMNFTTKESAGRKKHEPRSKNIYLASFFKNKKHKNGNKNIYVTSFFKNKKHRNRNFKKEKASTHLFQKREKTELKFKRTKK